MARRYIYRKTHGWLGLLALALMLFLSFGQQQGWLNSAKQAATSNQPGLYSVSQFVDGDTIAVNMNGKTEKVRFIGVDTPELHHPKKPVQCFAESAHQFTAGLINTNQVTLEADPEDDNRDIYGRLLRYIYLPDGTLVNMELIRSGHGFAYTRFPFVKKPEAIALEQDARQNSRGLWGSCAVEETDTGIQTNPTS